MAPTASGSALPIYLQISETLIRDIAAGRLSDGSRLAPERDLARRFGVAVGTLRKALADLEERGLLDRRQGSGNYVRAAPTPQGIYAFFRLEKLDGGGLPGARVLSVDRLRKPATLPSFGVSIDAHRIRRLRTLDGTAAALEEIWLDASFAERLAPEALSDSLYLVYRDALGLIVTGYEDRIGLGPCPAWAPADFGPRAGSPCGLVERRSHGRGFGVAEVSQTWFDGNVARYVARMKEDT
ncbi:MAG: GntR family transcriptional regulator [Pseudomonadota bacterium]